MTNPLHPFYPQPDGSVRYQPTLVIRVREVGADGSLGPELPLHPNDSSQLAYEARLKAAYDELRKAVSPLQAVAFAFHNVVGGLSDEQELALAGLSRDP